MNAQKIAHVYSGGIYLDFPCQTLDSLEDYTLDPVNLEFSKYGGWKAHQVEATGFFRVQQIDGRWWAVDPEGYLYIHKAVNSINLDDHNADWIYVMLAEYGFNGFGCWSDEDVLKSSLKNEIPMAYCPKISFIAEYRRVRATRIEMPVFDDAFEAYANNLAKGFASYVDDPMVFGYLSDNELDWRDQGLSAHLAITDHTDKNFTTAINFLIERGKTTDNWDTEDQYAYIALMGERYYSIVSSAIHKVDTNHMYIGTRCHSTERRVEDFMKNAGKYLDIFSTNHYNRWGARLAEITNMSEWSGCPLMITEFYAMERYEENGEGAGWSVENQESRSWFNDNYITTLAETGKLVGFHWFKYQDTNDTNKGIVAVDGMPYTALLNTMKEVNNQLYNYIDYLDKKQRPSAVFYPEADAYFKGSTNYGTAINLVIKGTSETSNYYRASYIRFDASTIHSEVAAAKIKIYGISEGSESGIYSAYWVEDNSWGETTINGNNKPIASTLLKSWGQGDDLEIDVTEELKAALNGDKKITICLASSYKNGSAPEYASREHLDSILWPTLSVYADTLTHLFQQEVADEFQVFPNPVSEVLNVSVREKSCIEVYNAMGILLHRQDNINTSCRIDVSDWDHAMYFVKIGHGRTIATQGVLKK